MSAPHEIIPEDDVPILIWRDDGADMLAYCEGCLGTREESRLQRAFDQSIDDDEETPA